MNFGGQYRKRRVVNMGGRSQQAHNREDVLRKAQLDRERRESERHKSLAGLTVKRFVQRYHEMLKIAYSLRDAWDEQYLSGSQEVENLSAKVITAACLSFTYFHSKVNDSKTHSRVAALLKMMENSRSEVAAVPGWVRVRLIHMAGKDMSEEALWRLVQTFPIDELTVDVIAAIVSDSKQRTIDATLRRHLSAYCQMLYSHYPELFIRKVVALKGFDSLIDADFFATLPYVVLDPEKLSQDCVSPERASSLVSFMNAASGPVLVLTLGAILRQHRTYLSLDALQSLLSQPLLKAAWSQFQAHPRQTAVYFDDLYYLCSLYGSRISASEFSLSMFLALQSALPKLWQGLIVSRGVQTIRESKPLTRAELVEMESSGQFAFFRVAVELYSYWLLVADDSELFENTSMGLSKRDAEHLSSTLKIFLYQYAWGTSFSNADVRFKSLIQTALKLFRQIYLRDSRKQFLPENFWLARSEDVNHATGFSAKEYQESLMLKFDAAYSDGDDDDGETISDGEGDTVALSLEELRMRKDQPHDGTVNLSWRTEFMRKVPFALPFATRVELFRGLVEDAERASQSIPQRPSPVTIRRGHVLEDAYRSFAKTGIDRGRLSIIFEDKYGQPEAGVDGGGLTKEFLTIVCDEGFVNPPNEESSFFIETENHQLYPKPSPEEKSLNMIHFLGMVIGTCLRQRTLVNVEFAPFFLQKLISSSRSLFDDLNSLDPVLYKNLVELEKYPGDLEKDLNINFTIVDTVNGVQQEVELKPNGSKIPVTNSNRLEYIRAVADYKLNHMLREPTKAFLSGIYQSIEPDWLKMFNANELQLLISGGTAPIDIEDLKQNCVLYGFNKDSRTIQALWRVLSSLDNEDRQAFVQFVTSVPKAPLLGFGALNPLFAIRNIGETVTQRLPSASTCVNLLKLPDYGSEEILRSKLLTAIRSKAGFDFS